MVFSISSTYVHFKDSVLPSAVFRISLFGGTAVMPHRIISSIRKASQVLKILPTLCALLILSRTTLIGVLDEFLKLSEKKIRIRKISYSSIKKYRISKF